MVITGLEPSEESSEEGETDPSRECQKLWADASRMSGTFSAMRKQMQPEPRRRPVRVQLKVMRSWVAVLKMRGGPSLTALMLSRALKATPRDLSLLC